MTMFAYFANPDRFLALSKVVRPIAAIAATIAVVWGLYLCFASPEDYQQGDTVRLMYIHVPSAWMGLLIYLGMGAASFLGLVFKHALADAAARAMAPVGMVFTGLALFTGSLWGKAMWGAWWQWDGRMTSTLVLFLFYIAYLALHAAIDDEARAARTTAVLAMVGLINLPIIKFSVEWWNSLHQGESIFRAGGPTISASMLWPLFVMTAAYHLVALWLILTRLETDIHHRREAALKLKFGQNQT